MMFADSSIAPSDMFSTESCEATSVDESFVRELESFPPLRSQEEVAHIRKVLGDISGLCRKCVRATGCSSTSMGQLLAFGSYRFGVACHSDDVDVVFVAPSGLQLSELSSILYSVLSNHPSVGVITMPNPDGHLSAPGWRFAVQLVHVKLLLAQRSPGSPQLIGDAIAPDSAGLLAYEVSEKIRASVKSVSRLCRLLRFVRLWAKQRGVYGSCFGLFGGTAWAVCCAHVCQLFPDSDTPQLLHHFFRTLYCWDWRRAVALAPEAAGGVAAGSSEPPAGGAVSGGSPPPMNSTLKAPSPMPQMLVELPVGMRLSAQPQMTKTTMKLLFVELQRAYKVSTRIEAAQATWADVYADASFFQQFNHYIQFDVLAQSDKVFAHWHNWCLRQMPKFAPCFEAFNVGVVNLRPWPESIEFKHRDWACSRAIFVGVELQASEQVSDEPPKTVFDVREPMVRFLEAITAWPESNKYENEFELTIRHTKRADLERWLEQQRRGMPVDQPSRNDVVAGHVQAPSRLHPPTLEEGCLAPSREGLNVLSNSL